METLGKNQIQSSQLSSPVHGHNTEQPQQQQQVMKGNFCAVYDVTAPRGCKLKLVHARGNNNTESKILTAKLNNIKLNREKNSVCKLNEMMSILKKNIQYQTTHIEGLQHSLIYTVCAQTEDFSVLGTGSSKKKAKIAAASAFIERMNTNNGWDGIISTTSNDINIPDKKKLTAQVLEDLKSQMNPIGHLQEVCLSYHWKLPCYEFTIFDTDLGYKEFEVNCLLYMYKTRSVQKSKKEAKKEAAHLMYEKIKKLSENEIQCLSLNIYPEPSSFLFHNRTHVRNKTKLDWLNMPESVKNMENFQAILKMSENPSVNKLKDLNFIKYPGSAVEFLDQMGEEEGFTSIYTLLSNPTSSQEGIMIQVSINHIMIHLGTGTTVDEAQEVAANSVLIYMKLILEV